MNISEKKKSALCDAINGPIMRARVKNMSKTHACTGNARESFDETLYKLNNEIWLEVAKTLKIENP